MQSFALIMAFANNHGICKPASFSKLFLNHNHYDLVWQPVETFGYVEIGLNRVL